MTTMQDLLGLGSDARFNTPGTAEDNWRWRVEPDALTDGIADHLADLTDIALR
jgi:4-alpha-glucanotransferase